MRTPRRSRTAVADAVLVVAALLLTWVGTADRSVTPGPRGLAVAAMVPGIAVLPWRRVRPIAALVVALVPDLAYWFAFGAPENVGLLAPLAVLLYTVGRWEPDRRRATTVVVVMVPVLALHEWLDPTNTSIRALLMALPYDTLAPGAWLLGAFNRVRSEQATSRADRIATDERTRIARELHDIVAHGIGVMVVQAEGAAEVVGRDPARAGAAMERVAQTGRESLVELRNALGMLRDAGPVAHDPLPGLARLDDLIDTVRQGGLRVTHETVGTPVVLPAGADLALYRVIQEALTNTLRHARALHASVRVEHTAEGVSVEVVDDGDAVPGQHLVAGGGLLGIRERILMLGGDVEVGPGLGGGFRVAVSVPRPAP